MLSDSEELLSRARTHFASVFRHLSEDHGGFGRGSAAKSGARVVSYWPAKHREWRDCFDIYPMYVLNGIFDACVFLSMVSSSNLEKVARGYWLRDLSR